MGKAFWNDLYRARAADESDEPNSQLAVETANLAPGVALDARCGEGHDAIWLARRGWRVMATDISSIALPRGTASATRACVGDRIDWPELDVRAIEPGTAAYDLVTAHFLYVARDARERVFGALARTVRPGGTSLVVGHHPSDFDTAAVRWGTREDLYTPDDVAAVLARESWRIVVWEGVAKRRRIRTTRRARRGRARLRRSQLRRLPM